jgi:hypothetical protein
VSKKRTVEQLADELFKLVQEAQGQGFVSDGWGYMDRTLFFAHVRQAHKYTKLAARQLKAFLDKYDISPHP